MSAELDALDKKTSPKGTHWTAALKDENEQLKREVEALKKGDTTGAIVQKIKDLPPFDWKKEGYRVLISAAASHKIEISYNEPKWDEQQQTLVQAPRSRPLTMTSESLLSTTGLTEVDQGELADYHKGDTRVPVGTHVRQDGSREMLMGCAVKIDENLAGAYNKTLEEFVKYLVHQDLYGSHYVFLDDLGNARGKLFGKFSVYMRHRMMDIDDRAEVEQAIIAGRSPVVTAWTYAQENHGTELEDLSMLNKAKTGYINAPMVGAGESG